MKKLFIAALLFVGIVSFAQDINQKPQRDQREKLTPEQRNEKHLQKLTSDLNLDAKQQEQVKQLLAERSAKAEKFRDARKDNKTKPTAEEKEAFKKQMTAELFEKAKKSVESGKKTVEEIREVYNLSSTQVITLQNIERNAKQ